MFTPPINPPRLNIPPEARPSLRVLPVGHILDATVARDAHGRLSLVAGRMRLPLPPGSGLQAGDAATLRVTDAGGQRGLEVLTRQPAASDSATRLQRVHLPRQRPVTESLGTLHAIADSGRLPPSAGRAVEATMTSLPRPGQLATPEGLRQAMRDSGSLFESLLATSPGSAEQIAGRDLRARLLQLAAQLRSAQGAGTESTARSGAGGGVLNDAAAAAQEAVDGALSRQLLNQLQARTADGHVQLVFELPVRHGEDLDDLRLEIREEAGGSSAGGEQSSAWSVTVRLAFAELGELEARLYYTAEGLAVTWSASTEQLRERVNAELPALERALGRADIPVKGIHVGHGPPVPRTDNDQRQAPGLIDDQA